MNKIADGYTHLTSVYYYNNCIIASEDLIRNEQDKTLSLRKRRIDEFFLKKRLHLNELTNINSDNCLELQKGDLTIPIELAFLYIYILLLQFLFNLYMICSIFAFS